MRRFVFRLQRALQFASLREHQKKAVIAAAFQRIRFLEKYLDQLDKRIQECLEKSRSEVGTLSAEAHRQAIVPTIEEINRAKGLLADEQEALVLRQRELVKASQRRRSLESLREKRVGEFKQESARKEQKAIDAAVGMVRGWQREREQG